MGRQWEGVPLNPRATYLSRAQAEPRQQQSQPEGPAGPRRPGHPRRALLIPGPALHARTVALVPTKSAPRQRGVSSSCLRVAPERVLGIGGELAGPGGRIE